MKIAVQKFGGSSLKDASQRELVASRILKMKQSGYSLVVVLSAMGRMGDKYATDTLLKLLENECPEVDSRELDLMMSCGETLSCIVMAAILRSKGAKAVPLTGFQAGIVTDGVFGSARIRSIATRLIKRYLEDDYIVIVAGFQGINDNMDITTLGRGGSDTTATALGAALGVDAVEIFTDVSGVMTVDPRFYQCARIIGELTYQEMGEMANEGAKVLHSRCVDLSREYELSLWVKGALSEEGGSHISSTGRGRIVTGLIHRTGLDEFICDLSQFEEKANMRRRLFEILGRDKISLDLINITMDKLYFTVTQEASSAVERDLSHLGIPFHKIPGMAKISCVGQGMKGTPGVMAAIYEALSSARIRIIRSVDSLINISCLIEGKDLVRAIGALHEKFELGLEQGEE